MQNIINLQNVSNHRFPKLLAVICSKTLAIIISNVAHLPSPNGTGINPVYTESDSMAEIVLEIVHNISNTISHTISAPTTIKNLLKTNEQHDFQ